jgi:DNA-binding transcriptional LysR family regulator
MCHKTIGYRLVGKDSIYRWELEEKGRPIAVDVAASITVNDGALGLDLARMGLGLAYTSDLYILDDLAKGVLQTTLTDYTTQSSGFFIYFAAGAQKQPKLRAFLDTLKVVTASARPTAGSKKPTAATIGGR